MPPPSLGLDLVSPVDNMDAAAALELSNIFPGAGAPSVRLGYEQTTALAETTPIGFMKELPRPSGTSQLIVANTSKIYSISTGGTATNISKVGGYVDSTWNSEIFANNIYMCNGVDNAQVYTGTSTCADLNATFAGGGSTLDKLINVNAHRERLFFVEKDTFKVWYHETNPRAVFTTSSSQLKSYDFQYNMKRGGYLLFTTNYTNQTADTSDDYFVAVSSEGEVVMYSGTHPDDSAWKPVAHFYIGKPLGRKSYFRMNQDIWIITTQGVVPVSALFQTDPEQIINVVSKPVNPIISAFSTVSAFGNRWHGFFWAVGRRAYINIPDDTGTSLLLVYSIDTKAWTTFTLYNAEHSYFATSFNGYPYYGSYSGKIYKGEYNYADNVVPGSSTGEAVSFNGRLAYSFYGTRGNYKAFKDVRPLMRARRGITLGIAFDTDFKRSTNVQTIVTPVTSFTAWGSPWGIGAGTINPITLLPMSPVYTPWSADVEYIYDRYATSGQGHCASIRFSGAVKNSPLEFLGFEVRYALGGQV